MGAPGRPPGFGGTGASRNAPSPRLGSRSLQSLAGIAACVALAATPALGVDDTEGDGAAAAPPDATFVVIGHLRGDRSGELWPWMDVLVEEVRRLEPDRVFLTGDLVWGEYQASPVDRAVVEADWERLDAALARLGAPVHRVPGNHDVNDLVTARLFTERYGALPATVRHGDDVFVLVDSTRIESRAPPSVPRPHTRPAALSPERTSAVRRLLAEAAPYRHAFVLLHHVLWWGEEAVWWREVHPHLRAAGVRAVFAGDMGPLKLSHTARDGIAYWQAALEGRAHPGLLRRLDGARQMHLQPDAFLELRVQGDRVEVRVHPVAIEASGKLSPAHFREITAPPALTLRERIDRTLGGPLRRLAFAAGAAALLALGGLLGVLLGRRRRR